MIYLYRISNIVFSMFDPEWDGGDPADRWQRWRPTVSLTSHPDFPVDRLELIVQQPHCEIARLAAEDIARLSPGTYIQIHERRILDPWCFEEVYAALHDIAENYDFDSERHAYYVHMSAGTHVARICLFLLCEARVIRGRMLQSYPADAYGEGTEGGWRVIDLTLAKYDRLSRRFERCKTEGAFEIRHRHGNAPLTRPLRSKLPFNPVIQFCWQDRPAPVNPYWHSAYTNSIDNEIN